MAEFTGASIVIGQGGIVGASVAHHLIERGWENIVGLIPRPFRPMSARLHTRQTSVTRLPTIT